MSHFKNYLAVIPKVIFNKDLLLEDAAGKRYGDITIGHKGQEE